MCWGGGEENQDVLFQDVGVFGAGGDRLNQSLAMGVLTGQVAAEDAELGFAGFILNLDDPGDVSDLDEGLA